jgi:hypothetical protein
LTLSFYMTPIEICRQTVEIRYFSHSLLSQITPSSSLPFLHKCKACTVVRRKDLIQLKRANLNPPALILLGQSR